MISNVNVNACLEDLIQTISGQEYSENSSVQSVLENIEALALEAGELEKHGFQDVCLLVQERISDIGDAEGQLTGEQYSLLNKWHELASVYLKHSSEETATALLEYCFQSGLFGEMQDSDLDIVKDMLGQEYINENKPDHLPQSDIDNNEQIVQPCTLEQLIEQARSYRQLGIMYISLQLKDGISL